VSDDEWLLVVSYLTLVREDAPQRQHSLRELFNALRYVVRYGIAWRAMPNDLSSWFAVYQQTQRWLQAGCFEALVHDLRAVLRMKDGRPPEPTAAIIDSRTLRSTRRAALAQAMTARSASEGLSCIWRSTRSATCSLCT
jgi:transposase